MNSADPNCSDSIAISKMKSITPIQDQVCEALSGGHRPLIRLYYSRRDIAVATDVQQNNDALNVAASLFGGAIAGSIQGNNSLVFTSL